MKKTLAIILTAVMVLSMVITAIPFSASAEEEAVLDPKNSEGLSIGEVAEDYAPAAGAIAIDSAEKFIQEFDGYTGDVLISDKDYYLTADITLPDDYWPDGYFAGTIDGCGYTINTKAPLFWALWPEGEGDAAAVVIKNLVINADIDVDGKQIGALAMTGGAYRENRYVIMDNIKVVGSVSGDSAESVGGLLGDMYGGYTATDIFVDLDTVYGGNVGGLVGVSGKTDETNYIGAPVTIKNVTVNANVSSVDATLWDKDTAGTGGLIGMMGHTELTIEDVNIYGTVTANSDGRQVGGIIGGIHRYAGNNAPGNINIKNCTNYADITNACEKFDGSRYGVGGCIGRVASTKDTENGYELVIRNFNNYGDITAGTNAGGFIGVCWSGCMIRIIGGANHGDVTVDGTGVYAGGIIGVNDGGNTISFNYDPEIGSSLEDVYTVNNGDITSESFGAGIEGGQSSAQYHDFYNVINNGVINAWNAGGVLGFAEQKSDNHFVNCTNNGNIIGANIGGIGGRIRYALTLEDCTNNGDLILVGEDDRNTNKGVGGIMGSLYSALPEELKNLKNTGNIYGQDGELYGHNVAGIIGTIGGGEWLVSTGPDTWGRPTFVNCVNEGDIIGGGDVAGIIAYANYAFNLENCVNDGDVTGKNAAGLVIYGNVGTNIVNTIGDVVIENNRVAGTITGTDSAAAIVIADAGLDVEDCLDNNVIYNTCNANAYISNGVATLTAQYPFVITNPDTGDNFAMGIVLSILAITAMGITAVVVLKKRVRN